MKNILKIFIPVLLASVVSAVIVATLVGNQSVSEDVGFKGTRFPSGLVTKEFTQGGGVLEFTATSTQSVRSLTVAELDNYNVIEIKATASPALTLNLPATSTFTTLLPQPGDFREWFIDNQQAAATTTTIVAGTGIDLIAVTNADDVIDGLETSRLSCYRKQNTDIMCIVSELLKAD